MNEESIQSKGGKARAESLTSKERSAIAKVAADARWGKTQNTQRLHLPLKDNRIVVVTAPQDIDPQEVQRLCEWIKLTLIIK